MMTIQEDYNQHWLSGFSARLNVTLRKRKHFPLGINSVLRRQESDFFNPNLGKEVIITGKTSGNLDNNDRLKVTDAVLRSVSKLDVDLFDK